jgi:hypothetical protein
MHSNLRQHEKEVSLNRAVGSKKRIRLSNHLDGQLGAEIFPSMRKIFRTDHKIVHAEFINRFNHSFWGGTNNSQTINLYNFKIYERFIQFKTTIT